MSNERDRKIGLACERAIRLASEVRSGESDAMLDSQIITAQWLLRSLVAARHGNERAYPSECVCMDDVDRYPDPAARPVLSYDQTAAPQGAGPTIEHALALASAALTFGQVERATLHPDGTPESDATHTVMLTMMVAELARAEGLDVGLAVQFATVHDLPETYAGDTCTARTLTPEAAAAKAAGEAASLARLVTELGPCWSTAMVERYEAQREPEARLVKLADKIMPKLTHILNGGLALASIGMDAAEVEEKHAEQRERLRALTDEFPATLALFDAACARALAMMRARPAAAPSAPQGADDCPACMGEGRREDGDTSHPCAPCNGTGSAPQGGPDDEREHYEGCEYPALYDQEADAHEAWVSWAQGIVPPGSAASSDEDMRHALGELLKAASPPHGEPRLPAPMPWRVTAERTTEQPPASAVEVECDPPGACETHGRCWPHSEVDRSEPPPGYWVDQVEWDEDGPNADWGILVDGRREHVLTAPSEEAALVDCWAHYDEVTAPLVQERDELRLEVDRPKHCPPPPRRMPAHLVCATVGGETGSEDCYEMSMGEGWMAYDWASLKRALLTPDGGWRYSSLCLPPPPPHTEAP